MKEAERIANKYEMKDAKIDTYYKLAECYKHLKMEDLTEDYRNNTSALRTLCLIIISWQVSVRCSSWIR
jgi:hypothetical protein